MKTTGIVAFAFGVPDTIRSNEQIAQSANQQGRSLNAPVYTQRDVRVEAGVEVTYTDEVPGKPPPTLRMARGAVQWAIRQGCQQLWIIVAKPHLWRAVRDIKEAVREAGVKIEVRGCQESEQYSKDSWFCPDSTQKRT